MGTINDISKILSNELIQSIFSKDKIKLAEINTVMNLLVSWNIPFDIKYNESSTSRAASILIRVKLSPTTVIEHLISLEAGVTRFR
ncbi:hypothetical protein GC105_03740 [Alkalibaculum sp. M08DMB]|uniref:Uncharacterized protein n=1 Tax=Alkalibaculum sporogenes TaxID=2655001 RepID=A0A6A7K688_9FIRM|nr:hypothetical protein [Alkalibaculum sporogenes]MPW24902.1 hypothetical protein [Alkalibaculum sporogenes]